MKKTRAGLNSAGASADERKMGEEDMAIGLGSKNNGGGLTPRRFGCRGLRGAG
jgi:hypothetical protein